MNKITKLLVGVAAIFAYACAVDSTVDSRLELENQHKTSLAISLEQTKTHIGEKSGETYPLYWSAGDQIAVNGVASEALTEEADGKAVAQFTLNGELAYPYNIVYPAPAEGVVAAEGLQVVTFQATQNYKVGSFAEGAAPMYAQVATEGDVIEMKHLAGVLCLVPQGDAVLTSLTVESASGKLAGNFDVNCADGTTTPQSDALGLVTVSFGEGLALSTEGTPIYVAVPAGDFGEVTVTLNTAEATEKMVVKFDTTGEKAVKAGVVREFGAFPFASNATTEYLITTKEDLIRFAEDVPTFTQYTVAKVAGAIDMTGVKWTPIEGFNYKFDGGKDAGYYIKGLSAPLFGTTSATIQNLKLTDVAITETEQGFVGSVARVLQNGSLTNCIASGSLVMNNTTYAQDLIEGYGNFNIGGLVGRSLGATYLDCTNQVAITITSIAASTNSTAYGTTVGGLTGRALTKCSFERCKNDAKLLYNGTTLPGVMYMCGLIGSSAANNDTIHLKDLENTANGVIEIAKNSVALKGLNLRGCIGVIYDGQDVVENITNNGDIKFLGSASGEVNISGIGGNLGAKQTARNLVNNGDIYFSGTAATSTNYIAGIATKTAGNVTHKIYDCHNTGDIVIDSPSAKQNMYCAGIISSHTNGITDLNGCTNTGDITVSSTLSAAYLSGMICHTNQKVTHTNCTNEGSISFSGTAGTTRLSGFMAFVETNAVDIVWNNCENKGSISHSGISTGITAIGGYLTQAAGGSKSTWNNCVNSGAITCSGHVKANLFVGGFFGYSSAGTYQTWYNCTNKGAITVGGILSNTDDKRARVGGFVGGTYSATSFYSCTNEGAITTNLSNESTSMIDAYAAGFVGDTEKGYDIILDKAEGSDKPCVNKGVITLSGYCGDYAMVAGLLASPNYSSADANETLIKNAVNEGEVKCINVTCTGSVRVGGVAGVQVTSNKTNSSQMTNASNKGNITVDNVKASELQVGGICGYMSGGLAPNGELVNVGNISVSNITTTTAGAVYTGGIAGYSKLPVEGAKCYCTINTQAHPNTGFIFGNARTSTVIAKNCQIGGEVAYKYDEEEDEYLTEKVSNSNFHKYIYGGGTTDWTGVENYDGCSALASKPAL